MPRNAAPITPLRLPRGMTHLVVFGGTFDPPHDYHAAEPARVAERLFGKRALVLYVPAARNPLKSKGPIASDADRLTMLALATKDAPGRTAIWTDEIDRAVWSRERNTTSKPTAQQPSFMVDTLERLRRITPKSVTLRLLVGGDAIASFHKWRRARRIIELAEPLVMPRPGVNGSEVVGALDVFDSLDLKFWTRAERAAWCTRLAPARIDDVSSTALRAAIARAHADARHWRSDPMLRHLPEQVAKHIREHRLYS
ncbi:MAG: nicotinate-nicotinamide nucleotide adenylyltransferase [Phycisphaerales bacterium]